MYQIAINLAKNVYRDRARVEHVALDTVIIRKNPRTLEALITKENRQQLRQALTGLPEKQRLTLLLRIQEDRKFEEIAEIMKCSVGTAKANYHHAVQKLKMMLREETAGDERGPVDGSRGL
jgi:RNA polymerase sigma-70 factor (ECF subfamily)